MKTTFLYDTRIGQTFQPLISNRELMAYYCESPVSAAVGYQATLNVRFSITVHLDVFVHSSNLFVCFQPPIRGGTLLSPPLVISHNLCYTSLETTPLACLTASHYHRCSCSIILFQLSSERNPPHECLLRPLSTPHSRP